LITSITILLAKKYNHTIVPGLRFCRIKEHCGNSTEITRGDCVNGFGFNALTEILFSLQFEPNADVDQPSGNNSA
jgi:hypothetical protein